MSSTYDSAAGGTRVLYIIATSDEPLSAAEIAEQTDATRSTVSDTLRRLYDSGFVKPTLGATFGKRAGRLRFQVADRAFEAAAATPQEAVRG